MEILIKSARIVDFSQDFVGDIYIKNGIIEEVGAGIEKDCPRIEAKGKVVMPAFVDTHAHFREPGFTYKEDILSGCRAAVRGGYTGVNLMANTMPVCSSMEIIDEVVAKGERLGLVEIHQCSSITRDFSGDDISHLDKLSNKVRVISEDGKDVMDSKVMMEAMFKAAKRDMIVMCHCEEHSLSEKDMRLSENMMTWRNIALAEFTGCRAHMAHVSTKEALDYCITSKKKGHKITVEVTPHHIALTEEMASYRVNPPLRSEEDRQYVIEAIKNGYVDTIGTDHAPHTAEDKEKGAPGLTGLETAFSVCYTELVKKGHISMSKLSEIMSKNPAQILKFNKGQVSKGFDGDLVIVDIDAKYEIDSKEFHSRGKNTPFHGITVWGKVESTIKGGEVVFS